MALPITSSFSLSSYAVDLPSAPMPEPRKWPAHATQQSWGAEIEVASRPSAKTPAMDGPGVPGIKEINDGFSAAAYLRQEPGKYGLGRYMDQLAAFSPTLQKQLAAFKRTGGIFRPTSSTGYIGRENIMQIEYFQFSKLRLLSQSIAHELGHFDSTTLRVDYRSKSNYIKAALAEEAQAVFNNLKIREELLAKNAGDIGVLASLSGERAAIAAYENYRKGNISRGALLENLAHIYSKEQYFSGQQEKTYAQVLGEQYEAELKQHPGRATKVFEGDAAQKL